MPEDKDQKRQHPRFETDVQVHFQLPYDFRTEVDFELDQEVKRGQAHKYIGFSKNISAQGLCFESNKELFANDILWLELHLPNHKSIIFMQGQVRWCRLIAATPETPKLFATGIHVQKVDGVDVEQTVYFDQAYHVLWSQLLEKVLGEFAKIHKKKIA